MQNLRKMEFSPPPPPPRPENFRITAFWGALNKLEISPYDILY